MVWLHLPVTLKGESKKLHRSWTGPFRMVKMLSEALYRIQNVCSHQPVVQFDCLKLSPLDICFPNAIPPFPGLVGFTSEINSGSAHMEIL